MPITNVYQDNTSDRKLRGQYFTPAEFVRLILDAWPIGGADRVIDPACGDGRFLCGAVETAARTGTDAAGLVERLIGFDIDPAAVATARANLRQAFFHHFGIDVPEDRFRVYQVDALRYPALPELLRELNLPALGTDERLTVIGNPPYVEAKRLAADVKRRLKAAYPGAMSGAPDLYLYFLHVCLGWLRPQDRLAFILPNKVLVNANARALRARLLDDGTLAQIWFATQAQLFPDAAIYPVVLFAHGTREQTIALRQVTRAADGLTTEPLGTTPHSLFAHTGVRAFFPLPRAEVLRALLARLLQDPIRLSDVCAVRWCVSFHRAGLRDRYVSRTLPETPARRPFLGGGAFSGNGEVARYTVRWAGWWIDYDEVRLKADGNQVPALSLFTRPKIILCQNGRTLRAAYDDSGVVLKDTFLCGVPIPEGGPLGQHPRALVGLLNSALLHFFYAHVFYGGHVGGGYLHFLNTFLADLPTGHWTPETAAALAELVRRREQHADEELDAAIERMVADAFNLTRDETEALEHWLADDENWRLRVRLRAPR